MHCHLIFLLFNKIAFVNVGLSHLVYFYCQVTIIFNLKQNILL